MDMNTPGFKANRASDRRRPDGKDGESRGESPRPDAPRRRAFEQAGIPYSVIGGNAVAAHVGRIDESAVRNTQDVDILLRRTDLEAAKAALANAGFVYRHVKGIDMFLDGPKAKARDAVRVIFAGEKVRSVDPWPAPEIGESEATPFYRVVALESLVKMKLTSFRLKDRVHILDMIGVGLIGQSQSVIPSRASLSRPRRFTSSALNKMPGSPRSNRSMPG